MGGSRHRRRRRNEPPTPIELLLSDPATVHAATDAFARAEQPENAAWPFVASVGLRTVTLRWAFGSSASVPEPRAPWRPGRDPRVWIADRDEIGVAGPPAGPAVANAALAIGQFEETVVFINTSRAPGPIAVADGGDEDSVLLRELIARQARSLGAEWLQDGAASRGGDGERRGAWWPMEIEGDAIVLLGLAIARMFTADEARLACELMQRTATEERQRQTYVVGRDVEAIEAPVIATAPASELAADSASTPETEYIDKWRRLGYVEEEPEPTTPENADLEDWLRQVKAAAAARVEPASVARAAPPAAASFRAASAPAVASSSVPSSAPISASTPALAATPAPASTMAPASAATPAPGSGSGSGSGWGSAHLTPASAASAIASPTVPASAFSTPDSAGSTPASLTLTASALPTPAAAAPGSATPGSVAPSSAAPGLAASTPAPPTLTPATSSSTAPTSAPPTLAPNPAPASSSSAAPTSAFPSAHPTVAPGVTEAHALTTTGAQPSLPTPTELPVTGANPALTIASTPTSAGAPVPPPVASTSAAGSSARTSAPSPAPVEDDLDDWVSGFAVSSADQTAHR